MLPPLCMRRLLVKSIPVLVATFASVSGGTEIPVITRNNFDTHIITTEKNEYEIRTKSNQYLMNKNRIPNNLGRELALFPSVKSENTTPRLLSLIGDIRGGGLVDEGKQGIVSFYNGYMSLLDQKPLLTKSITSGIITAIGNVLSQTITNHVASKQQHDKTEKSTTVIKNNINIVQLVAFILTGAVFVGPFVHYWYDLLAQLGMNIRERWGCAANSSTNSSSCAMLSTLVMVFVDQTIGVAMYFPTYFYIYEAFESMVTRRYGLIFETATKKLKREMSSVLWMQYRIWPFTNFINFAYVPQNLRVLFSNTINVFWSAYLCAKVA